MLTPELLASRLKAWSTQVPAVLPPTSPAPIALYQHFFALLHDLKTSVQLSENTAIQSLSATVLASDVILHRLAYGEIELTHGENENLYKLACSLEMPEALEVFLTQASATATAPASVKLELLGHPYPWDGLSRARAISCARHGYSFQQREDAVRLRELPALESSCHNQIHALGGMLVVRKLDAGAVDGTDLMLQTKLVVALPPGSAPAPAPWLAI